MMKKHFLISTVLFSGVFYAQNNCDNVKLENTNLKFEIQSYKNENNYLKKVLAINSPILESEKNNDNFRITKIIGNKADKTVLITIVVEAKDENKNLTIQNISFVDLEGKQFKADLYKSSRPFPELSANVPLKLSFSFKDVLDEPKILKIFRFRVDGQPTRNLFEKKRAELEFRDLKVDWN